jgi:hypothetical protein
VIIGFGFLPVDGAARSRNHTLLLQEGLGRGPKLAVRLDRERHKVILTSVLANPSELRDLRPLRLCSRMPRTGARLMDVRLLRGMRDNHVDDADLPRAIRPGRHRDVGPLHRGYEGADKTAPCWMRNQRGRRPGARQKPQCHGASGSS